jgi:hypothetical protein
MAEKLKFLTLATAEDHELAGFVCAVEVESAQLGLAPAPVHRQAADRLPWLQHTCTLQKILKMCLLGTKKYQKVTRV